MSKPGTLSDVAIAERLRAIAERKAHLVAAKATREAAASLPPSPEEQLRAAEEELARLEREEADERAWAESLAKHGKGKVARVPTRRGAIILRARGGAQMDADAARIASAKETGGAAAVTAVARECLLDQVEYPSKDAVRKMLEEMPGHWSSMYSARDALDFGEAEDLAGKA